jgi:predicted DNA-binding antitoxin AbrB/MazE fold protein
MDMMLEAIYEEGVLRPTSPLKGLADGQRVWVIVRESGDGEDDVAQREAELLRRLEADGLLVHAPPATNPPPSGFRPISLQGELLSEEIIRDRR